MPMVDFGRESEEQKGGKGPERRLENFHCYERVMSRLKLYRLIMRDMMARINRRLQNSNSPQSTDLIIYYCH